MNKFSDFHILRILSVIRYQMSIDSLLDVGLEYSQIARLISYVLDDGLVDDADESGLVLTSKGIEMLDSLKRELYPENSSGWILPSEESRIPKIDKYDIYLPRKKKNV